MKNKLSFFIISIALLVCMIGCNTKVKKEEEGKKSFVLNGTLTDIDSGEAILINYYTHTYDTTVIENGKFTFTGDYFAPIELALKVNKSLVKVYAENITINLTASSASLSDAVITGSSLHDEFNRYNADLSEATKEYTNMGEYLETIANPDADKESKEQARKILASYNQVRKEFRDNWFKNNPTSRWTAYNISTQAIGANADQLEGFIAQIAKVHENDPIVIGLRKKHEKLRSSEVTFEKFIPNASNITYKVDKSFSGDNLKGVYYLAAFKNNNICGLRKDGSLIIFSSDGTLIKTIESKVKGRATSVAIDIENNIYVIEEIGKEVTKKHRGKSYKKFEIDAVECNVLDVNGKQLRRLSLKGLGVSPAGARVASGKLMVSNVGKAIIGIFDAQTGKQLTTIKGMRPCCGILDFTINKKEEIVVANVAAFRVQHYDLDGNSTFQFGSRGNHINDFFGCCNPVSVACLSNGAIVTAEKDPTRIKIYSKEGAKQIHGIGELVKTCTYIPMIADGKDNIYLASPEKGIVKCISAD
jgi:hypothetical protein